MPLSQISLLSLLKGCYQNLDANRMLSGNETTYAFLYSPGSKRNTSISAEIQEGVIFKGNRSCFTIHMCRHVSRGSDGGEIEHSGRRIRRFGQSLIFRDHLQDLDVDGLIIKLFLNRLGGRISNGFIAGRHLLQR